jgi:hypothetical protein
MHTKYSNAEVKMDCEHLEDTLGDQLSNPSDVTKCEKDEPKTMAGHQATKRMAKCCVPNAVGAVRSLIKSMTVLNEARIRIKKKTLRTTMWVFVIVLIRNE